MWRIRLIAIGLVLASPYSALADPIQVQSGRFSGLTFNDLLLSVIASGFDLGGYVSFPIELGTQLEIGHLNQNVPLQPDLQFFFRVEYFFEPTDVLLTFRPGTSVTRSFTMTGLLTNPTLGVPPVEFIAQGTFEAGWFPQGPNFGLQFFRSTFAAVPEPSTLVLLLIAGTFLALRSTRRQHRGL